MYLTLWQVHLLKHQATDLLNLAGSPNQHTCRKVSTTLAHVARAQQGAKHQQHLNRSDPGASAAQVMHPPREPILKTAGQGATKKQTTTHPLLKMTNHVSSIRAQNAHLTQEHSLQS